MKIKNVEGFILQSKKRLFKSAGGTMGFFNIINIIFDGSKISKLPIWSRYLIRFIHALLCFFYISALIVCIFTKNITGVIIFGIISIIFVVFWIYNLISIKK